MIFQPNKYILYRNSITKKPSYEFKTLEDKTEIATVTIEFKSLPLMDGSKAIKAKCADCSGGEKNGVRDCHIVKCPLWPYRFGCSPKSAANQKEPYYDIVLVDVNKVDYIEQLGK